MLFSRISAATAAVSPCDQILKANAMAEIAPAAKPKPRSPAERKRLARERPARRDGPCPPSNYARARWMRSSEEAARSSRSSLIL